ncbi:Ig-like domain-containing protein [Crateriforma conspicua]|uniref:Ig-like domain-containing protein n=1 Tax=Crateriforma conspicua TaxID=2527996 RepID=UPI00118C9CF5|nr:DUF1573 domain-containing protein [Crateriforma conspicua]QDV65908.1 hypothetical protein Mal65_50810 [Crateriforma conspicua]
MFIFTCSTLRRTTSLALLIVGSFCVADDPGQLMNENRGPLVRKDPIKVVNNTNIGGDSGTLARCEIDLGEHPPAALLHCIVTIRNVGNRMLRFSRVESGCACLSVAPAKGEISSGESLTFRLQIETVQRPTRVVQTATFTCHDDAIPSMSVKLRYGLTGVVGFTASDVHVRVPEGAGDYFTELSFFADRSSVVDLIDFGFARKTDSTDQIDVSIDEHEKKLRLKIPESVLQRGAVFNELFIKNIETGHISTLPVTISKRSAISKFPKKLRFIRHGDETANQDDIVSAAVMVLDLNQKQSAEEGGPALLKVSYCDQPLKTVIVGRNGQLTHYSVDLPMELVRSAPADRRFECRCEISGVKNRRVVTLPVSQDVVRYISEVEGDL